MIKDSLIAKSFQLATDFETAPRVHYPMIASEKLNGLRCKYYPGRGFFSKKGILWSASVLAHLKMPDFIVDGELWAPGMSLQEITSAVGIARYEPGPGFERIRLMAFDAEIANLNALDRRRKLAMEYEDTIHYSLVRSDAAVLSLFDTIRAAGGEGAVYQAAYSPYTHGKTRSVLKIKAVKDGEFVVVRMEEGEGAFAGMLGSFTCLATNGKGFSVGTGLSPLDRLEYWSGTRKLPTRIKVAYEMLSADGIPLKPRFIAEDQDV